MTEPAENADSSQHSVFGQHGVSSQHSVFDEHTIESAPPSSRRFMTATANSLGYLPSATARWAASPQLLDAFAR